MNPETVQKNAILNETITLPEGATSEQMRAAVAATMERVNAAMAAEEKVKLPVNPYQDRVFVPSEKYPGRRRAILLYPNERLGQVSKKVGAGLGYGFADEDLNRLAADLVATARAADAAGLSAIQVGEPVRVCVVRISQSPDFVVLVNPSVDIDLTQRVVVQEGCISFPGVKEKVERSNTATVYYQDLEGGQQEMALIVDDPATYVAGQAVQHEVEHLDGLLLLSNLNLIRRDRVRLHMKQVHRKLNTIVKRSGGKLKVEQVLFGYVPDPA